MDQNLQLQYFRIPASEQGQTKSLIAVLDCSGSMSNCWKYVADCFNDLQKYFVSSSAITFDTTTKVVPPKGKISENINEYGGGGTDITTAFVRLNEEIKNWEIQKDLIILFVSDGQGSYDENRIKSTMTGVENLDFVCLGVGNGFPTRISMSLRKLYHSGDLSIPPLFIVETNYNTNLENNFHEQFGLIQQSLKYKRQQVPVSPCFQFPWDEQQTNNAWSSSWVSAFSQTLEYNNNFLQPETITENQIVEIGNYWLQNIQLLSLQRKVVKEADVAFAEMQRLHSLLPGAQIIDKKGKKSFAQRIKSQKKEDVSEYDMILEELKEFKQSFTLQQLNDKDAADRLKIGSKVGKFHKKALKFAGLSAEEYLKAKTEFIQCLKEHKFQGDDGERSIMTLQSQKEILGEQDLIEGLQLCESQYALVTQFPIIGYGLQIKRSNASMIDPYRVEIVSLVRIHKYLDSVSLIEAPDHQIKFKVGNDEEEIVNCILPLYRKENQDLIPFFRSGLFHTIMTFVVCENADVCFDYAYSALLANTFYYLIQQPDSEWRNEMIALITESYQLAYGQKNHYFHEKLVANPIQTLVDINDAQNTMCQDTIRALLALNLLKDSLSQEQIKLIVDRILIESIGRALHEVPVKELTNLFINQTNEKGTLETLSEAIIEGYDAEKLKTFKSMSAITGNIKNEVDALILEKFNIVLTFNQENVLKYLNKSKYKYNALLAIYEFYFKAEIPLNFLIAAVFHARYTKSPERANNQVIEDMAIINNEIIQMKFGQLKLELLEICKVNIRDQVQKQECQDLEQVVEEEEDLMSINKNLEIYIQNNMKEIQVQCQQSYEVSILGFTFDELSKVLYVVNKELDIVKYQYTNKTLNIVSTLSEQVCNDSEILSFQYLMENDSLILVFRNGQIVKVQKEEAEVVGQFDCGVLAAAWNPNQEQLIVLCADGKLVSFDAQLEPTKEITIDVLEQPAAISFKNDGKFFSLNYSVPNGQLCQTYDVQLEKFQSSSKSDPEGGLVQAIFERPRKMQNTVAWQPNNGFIGGIEGQQVIFWEKNGLRHLEFDLFEEGQELLWSPDGLILAVKHNNKIGLYLRQNYKWYCKQMFNFDKVIGYTFIETNTLVVFTEGTMQFYWLNYQYNNTSIGLSTNQNKLLVTNYKKGVVPPPMCHFELQVDSQINLVYYQQYIYIYTLSGILYIYNHEKLVGKVSVNIQNAHKLICYTDSDVVFGHAVFVVHEEGRDQIADVVISPEFEVINIWRKEFSQPTQISAITITNHQVLLHSRFGEKFIYDQSKEECLAEFDLANWEQNVYDVKIQQHGESLACLKSNAKLMLNNQLITGDCTSFAFFDHFLAFTLNTADLFHNLYILDLNKPLQIDKKSLNISNIERGAKILAIVALDRLIVQVPRGNLETTAPRVMVLHLCKQLHDQKRYKECFEAIRKHKLDMNLMFDFTGDMDPLIVEQLSEQYLQLFIQSLNNTVSFELPYVLTSEQYKHIQAQIIDRTLGSTKINYVCQKLIDNMKEDTHILTIVTAMLKKEPSEVEEALLKTLTLKQNEQHQDEEIPPHLNPDTLKPYKKHHKIKSEQVLEYICWLADANKMFEVALGTYDFDLVKQVAQFTQKDPKEYLPMLERYANIKDPVDMKSTIHLELKNYDKAIRVLATGNEEQKRKSIEIIRKQSRFRVALEVYRDDATIIKQVKEALGDYLIEQKQHHQASLAYESAGLFEKAVKASIEILDTKRILSFEPTSEQLVVYQESLLSAGRWKDCGEVQEYLKNYEQAIHYYCKAEEWDKVALCLRHNHIQIDDHLQLAYSLKVNHMLNQEHLFVQKFERLRIVQEQKKEHGILAPTQLQADFDQISDVSGKSGVSKSSYTMSVTTGVRKRKPKEKSFLTRNIKPGSPVEEEYLVEFLRDIQNKSGEVISTNMNILGSVKKFQNYLIYFNRPTLSQDLSIRAKEYLKTIKPEIKSLAQLQFEEKNPEAIDLYQKVQGTIEFTQLLDDLIK